MHLLREVEDWVFLYPDEELLLHPDFWMCFTLHFKLALPEAPQRGSP